MPTTVEHREIVNTSAEGASLRMDRFLILDSQMACAQGCVGRIYLAWFVGIRVVSTLGHFGLGCFGQFLG